MDFIITTAHALQDDIIARCHPEWWMTLYLAERLSLDKIIGLVNLDARVAKIRLHSAAGKMYNKTADVVGVLRRASDIDRLTDLEAIIKACSATFVKKMVLKMTRSMRGELSNSKSTDWPYWSGKYTLLRRPPGTYSRFSQTFLECDAVFPGNRCLFIRFNRQKTTTATEFDINGRRVYIPHNTRLMVYRRQRDIALYVDWPWADVKFRKLPMVGVIKSDGSAVFTRQGAQLEDLVRCWEDEDVLSVSDMIGVACSHCIWCDRELTDSDSVKRGSGPVCARRYNPILSQLTQARKEENAVVQGIGAQPVGDKRQTLFSRHATATNISLPPKVAEASVMLSGLVDCDDEPDEALIEHLRTMLGVDAEAMDTLEEMLERPGWFPMEESRIQRALVAAHALGLPRQEKLLVDVLVDNYGLVEHPEDATPQPEVVKKAEETRWRIRVSGQMLTAFKTGKRKREIDLATALHKAVINGWAKEVRDLLENRGATVVPPANINQRNQHLLDLEVYASQQRDPEIVKCLVAHGMHFKHERMATVFNRTNGAVYAEFLSPGFDATQFADMVCSAVTLHFEPLRIAIEGAPAFRITEAQLKQQARGKTKEESAERATLLMERFEGAVSDELLCYCVRYCHPAFWGVLLASVPPLYPTSHLKASMESYSDESLKELLKRGYIVDEDVVLHAFSRNPHMQIIVWNAYSGPVTDAMIKFYLDRNPLFDRMCFDVPVMKKVFETPLTAEQIAYAMNKVLLYKPYTECRKDPCFLAILQCCRDASMISAVLDILDSDKYTEYLRSILSLMDCYAYYTYPIYDAVDMYNRTMDLLLALKARGATLPEPKKWMIGWKSTNPLGEKVWDDVKARLGYR